MFIVRTIRSRQIHSVGIMQNFSVYIRVGGTCRTIGFKELIFSEKESRSHGCNSLGDILIAGAIL
jgi:hypothetical protein